MSNPSQGDVSDAPKILSEDGTLNSAAFEAALSQSSPFAKAKAKPEVVEEETEEIVDEEVEETEETETTEEEAEAETEESDDSEESEDSEEEDVLSQIDVESLTKEQKTELAKMLGTDLGKDIKKVRGDNAKLRKEIEDLTAQLQEGLGNITPISPEFKEISSTETLEEKTKEWRANKDYIDNLMVGTDEEFEINGEYRSRKEVAQWGKYYESLLEKAPEHRQRLKELSGYSEKDVIDKLKEQIPDIEDEDSEVYKAWRKAVDDPQIALIKQIAPKAYAKIQQWAAHSAAFGNKKSPPKSFKLPLKKAKNIGTRSTAASTPSKGKVDRSRQEAWERVQSGNYTQKDLDKAMGFAR